MTYLVSQRTVYVSDVGHSLDYQMVCSMDNYIHTV
jgi:hypothetical protein